ncbi:hypothetical protein BDQ12DRAFT_726309 [Crucibulum laeve]|uniref:Uncharacterized protein n=1 Tax=Crucibulum laeve TaxID=68775 RepID=A0A5C3LQU2_9AGAR|nr:hypothetical protein BDQ12DRAFT_726309 [Crucibulum laeve]
MQYLFTILALASAVMTGVVGAPLASSEIVVRAEAAKKPPPNAGLTGSLGGTLGSNSGSVKGSASQGSGDLIPGVPGPNSAVGGAVGSLLGGTGAGGLTGGLLGGGAQPPAAGTGGTAGAPPSG